MVVFDVDGTLYRQGRLRALMAVAMSAGLLRGELSATDIRVLRTYRRMREQVADRGGPVADAVDATASKLRCSTSNVLAVQDEWLLRRPLAYLPRVSLAGVAELIESLRDRDIAVVAWSDYPAEEKTRALGLRFDYVVVAGDTDVPALKPDPSGLLKALKLTGVTADQTLVVGDRDERDGAAARAIGAEYLIVRSGLTRHAISEVQRQTMRV